MKIVLFVLCLMGLYCATEACSCNLPMLTEKGKYCKADFVFKVKVKTSLINEYEWNSLYKINVLRHYYKTRVLRKYKNEKVDSVIESRSKRIYTGRDGGSCGISLTKGETYLISGMVSGGRRKIDSCNSRILSPITKPSIVLLKRLIKHPDRCERVSRRH